MNKDELKDLLKGANYQVYTKLDHVSQSGMTRHITMLVIVDNEPQYLSYAVTQLLNYKLVNGSQYSGNGIKVRGVGMDMGYHLVHQLSSELFKDGYKLKHRWI